MAKKQAAPKSSDLKSYIAERKKNDPEFLDGFDEGYRDVEFGVLLRQARQAAGLTQAQLAQRVQTQKTAISRLENRASDVKLSTLRKVAKALGKRLELRLT